MKPYHSNAQKFMLAFLFFGIAVTGFFWILSAISVLCSLALIWVVS